MRHLLMSQAQPRNTSLHHSQPLRGKPCRLRRRHLLIQTPPNGVCRATELISTFAGWIFFFFFNLSGQIVLNGLNRNFTYWEEGEEGLLLEPPQLLELEKQNTIEMAVIVLPFPLENCNRRRSQSFSVSEWLQGPSPVWLSVRSPMFY